VRAGSVGGSGEGVLGSELADAQFVDHRVHVQLVAVHAG